jgi:prepilin-type N-terminal cleavage/methylation domain-containing protein
MFSSTRQPRPLRPRQTAGVVSRRAGFTLIEVLVTLLLIVIFMPIAMEAMKLSSGAGSLARHRTEASQLAQSKLNELIATGDWQTAGNQSGDFGQEWQEYQWTTAIDTWNNAGVQVTDMQQLTVTVTWQGGAGGQQSVAFTTLVRATDGAASGSSSTSGSTSSGTGTTGGK